MKPHIAYGCLAIRTSNEAGDRHAQGLSLNLTL